MTNCQCQNFYVRRNEYAVWMQKIMYQIQQQTQTHMLQFRMSANYIKELEQQINKLKEEIVELKAKLALQQEDRSTVKRKYKNCTIGMKMK